ncbi:TPA: aspartate ammonia-lyase [Candidatus Micrarchaeota archaeon]|nr:aspartate ammonia-lyase [Candidatus Micrarchaeota archaeon]
MTTRTEEDFIGKIEVPADAYYGGFAVRAAGTFKLSGMLVHPEIITGVALIKKAAAATNKELGKLDGKMADAIIQAAGEVIDGKKELRDSFILDAFQAGAGTPLHMNTNEVIANRAIEILGGQKGDYSIVHPNNHVNMSQSSNDVTPTAIRLAALKMVQPLILEGERLEKALLRKAEEFASDVKCGRTHLQDAVPITYGQVFHAFAVAVRRDVAEITKSLDEIRKIGIGGTAVGTGITCHPKFRERIIQHLDEYTKFGLSAAESAIETTHAMNPLLCLSGALRLYAITLNRIANDLRLLVSGPKTAIAEVIIPEIEPGSSIMPGKVNPSVPEAVNMCCFQVLGNDHTISLGAQSGQLELNWMTPLIGYNLLQSLELLTNATNMFRERCIKGTELERKNIKKNFDSSFVYATALNPYLGYSLVSKLVTEAYKSAGGISLRELILQKGFMTEDELKRVLAPEKMTGPTEVDKEIVDNVRERIKLK